jgi:hypothetical protein
MSLATTQESLITTTFHRLSYVGRRFVNELVEQENRVENYSILIHIPHNVQCDPKKLRGEMFQVRSTRIYVKKKDF